MRSVWLGRRNPARNMARFYTVRVVPTLFGAWALVREWGRIGSPGQLREDWFGSEAAASNAGDRLVKTKTRRGYKSSRDRD
jgi:predicted DNA-binding WGR domain protein